MARALVLVAVAGALLVTAWLGLEAAAEGVLAVGKIVGLALVPAVAFLAWRRLLVSIVLLAAATPTALGFSLDVPLTDMRPWSDRDFWGPVFAAGADGFRDMYEARTPFDRLEHPELAGLVLLAIFAFLVATALLVVTRHRLWAGLVLLVGVGFPATVAVSSAQSAPLRTGALVLGALLVFLFLSREGEQPFRRLLPALGLGGLVVLVAVAASTSGAVSKGAFVGWQRWDFYDPLDEPVGVHYVWSSNYDGIEFPKEKTVVLRIKAPHRLVFWRATTLDEYTGRGWEEIGSPREAIAYPGYPWQRIVSSAGAGAVREVAAAPFDPLLPDAARDHKQWTRQHVTVAGLADRHLVAASEPMLWQVDIDHSIRTVPGGPVIQRRGLVRDEQYTVWSYTADVQPKDLAQLPVADSPELGRFLEVLPGLQFPAFGVEGRDAMIEQFFSALPADVLPGHELLYAKARELVGDTTSPYLAAATLETWFRSSGEFTYDTQPGPARGSTPPLVDFVLRGKRGYCQHFAGAMALMLRLLGVPARVGAGFVTGTWDDRRDEWVVTDHDAHTWVEVYFPGYGWLTFNPTPERGDLAASYSTTSSSFPDEDATALGVDPEALTAALLSRLGGIDGSALPSGTDSGSQSDAGSGAPGVAGLVAAAVAGLIAVLLLVKAARRRLRFVGRDARGLASACRRDLVAFLADQRIPVSATATLAEIGGVLEDRFSVSPAAFVRAASSARFGPPADVARSARQARHELRALERELRRELGGGDRIRGAFSTRSLGV